MKKQCNVSIITPSLNQGIFIEDNIQSVLNQSYENIEHIIIDSCSTDDTIQTLKKYSHLNWISEKDKGASNAINKGLKMAKGDIVAWLNSDDYYEKNAVSDVAEVFNNFENVNIVYGNLTFVNENKEIIRNSKTEQYDIDRLIHNDADIVRQPCTFFRKELFDKVGGLDENLKCVFDYDLLLKMLLVEKPYYLDKNLAFYREYKNTLTRKFIRLQGMEIIKVSRKYGSCYFDKIVISSLIKKVLFPFIFYR